MNNTNQEKRVPEKLERIRNEWRDLDMTNMLVTLTDKINEILSYLSVKEERGNLYEWMSESKLKEEDWREDFDKTFVNKFGAENLHLCLVPSITENNKLWVTEIVTKDIKSFISNLLSKSKEEEKKNYREKVRKFVISALDKEI